MRVVVVGLGVQGHKRRAVAGSECIATVDPVNTEAQYRKIEDVPYAVCSSAPKLTLGNDRLILARDSSPSSSPAKTIGSLRPLP